MSPLARGLVHMELHRGDGSLGHVPRRPVRAGDEVDRAARLRGAEGSAGCRRWRGWSKIGAFALTEPDHGSDSVALETTARRDGDEWVIDGAKRWIGNGSIADVVVVWARDAEDGKVKGFLVETDTPGFDARRWRARAPRARSGRPTSRSTASGSAASGCRARTRSRTPAGCSRRTRSTCAWAALGHAVAAYDAALTYGKQRQQFGKPLCQLPDRPGPAREDAGRGHRACSCTACSSAASRKRGQLTDTIAGLAKLNNTRKARQRDRRGARPAGRQRRCCWRTT